MKKKFLTVMLLFAFLMVGIQNATAQYVTEAQALVLLADEIESVETNPIYYQEQDEHPSYEYLTTKMTFYTSVYESIYVGETIPTSIDLGEQVSGTDRDSLQPATQNADGETTLSILRQEIEDLLEQ